MPADFRRCIVPFALLVTAMAWFIATPAASAHDKSVTPAKTSASGAPLTLSDYEVKGLKAGGEFTLRNQDGKLTRLRDFRAQPLLMFFGYTFCPDICPLTTTKLAHLKTDLAAGGTPVNAVLVSIDPERDTPKRMKEYLANFKGGVVGLTGSVEAVKRTAALFHVRVQKEEADGLDPYLVGHTAYIFLLDGEGRLRYLFPADAEDALISEGVRQLSHG